MFRDSIRFGIETSTGKPYVQTCRGGVTFDEVEPAAAFVAARVRARLHAYASIWDSFQSDVESLAGSWEPREQEEVPF